MLLIKANGSTVEQYPYSLGMLRKDNPNTSFPKQPSVSDMAAFNVYPVTETFPTVGDGQHLVKVWTPTLVGSDWVLAHEAVDLTDAEVAAATAVIAADAREKRDALLAATDFYALSDVVMTSEMTTYRSNLRSVPTLSGFPNDFTWPTAP
tara:strand:- start:28 stop:477 length:450 start_codon:yes stop_codon:yes gene_type:complete